MRVDSTQEPVLVLCGYRKAAHEAARELGFRPLSLDLRDTPLRARPDRIPVPLGRGATELLREALDGEHPYAVVAVSESGVAVAGTLREALRLPGPRSEVLRRCTDKLTMKRALEKKGIPLTRWCEVRRNTRPEALVEKLGLPLVLKPRRSSGGRGVQVAHTLEEVGHALPGADLAEAFLQGEEMSVETFLQDGRILFQNFTHYLRPGWASVVPAPLGADREEQLRRFTQEVHAALGVEQGMTHMEVYLTENGIYFGELGLRPPGGRIMDLIAVAWDFDPWRAFLDIELDETPRLPDRPRGAAGVWFLHPGPGVVQELAGFEEVDQEPDVLGLRCRVGPGETVGERLGTGQSIGELMIGAPDPRRCIERLEELRPRLRVTLR